MTGRLAGVVLAGGLSRRMGRDKATLKVPGRFADKTLVEHLVSVMAQRLDPVFVVAAQEQSLPELSATVLRDAVPGLGPLPAIGVGLRAAAQAGVQGAFVCAVDMPLLTAGLIGQLADGFADGDADIVLPCADRDHYLAGVYRVGLAPTIEEMAAGGERRVGALVDSARVRRIVPADVRVLANLNSPEDISELF